MKEKEKEKVDSLLSSKIGEEARAYALLLSDEIKKVEEELKEERSEIEIIKTTNYLAGLSDALILLIRVVDEVRKKKEKENEKNRFGIYCGIL